MSLNGPFSRRSHNKTQYIQLNTHHCRACWMCVAACPQHVLGKVDVLGHRHAHVNHPEACKGCKKCVLACPHDAIQYTYQPVKVEDRKPSGAKQ